MMVKGSISKNLFSYATSELSQDAFLCWLLSHGDAESEGTQLHECALAMLRKMCGNACVPREVIDIQRQNNHIDVMVEIIADDNLHYHIIIEDKTNTIQHDDQLRRYKGCVSKNVPEERIIGVYYKSGLQGYLAEVSEAGYNILLRKDILEVLSPYASKSESEILKDYFEHLYQTHNEAEKYRILPFEDWDWAQIEAFFDELLLDENWCEFLDGYGYVANAQGGFYALCSKSIKIPNKPWELYLQLEFCPKQAKICLKGTVDDPDIKTQSSLFIDTIVHREKEAYAFKPWFERPDRLISAHWMTFGVIELDTEGLYLDNIKIRVADAINGYQALRSSINNGNI